MKIYEFFESMWYKKIRSDIFLILYKWWSKPASTVAKLINKERTNTYKTLQEMSREWLIAETNKWGTKHFFVANKEVLNNIIEQKKNEIQKQENLANIVGIELDQLDQNSLRNKPFIRYFEWDEWIKNAFKDILHIISSNWYKMIKVVASNTLDERGYKYKYFLNFSESFFEELKQQHIYSKIYLWNGIMTLEKMTQTDNIEVLKEIPAWESSAVMILVGDVLYTFFFKDIPTCIKIKEEKYTNLLHFLLNNISGG